MMIFYKTISTVKRINHCVAQHILARKPQHNGVDIFCNEMMYFLKTSGNTPLHFACANGHVNIAKELLDRGAGIEDQNENGHTPLMEAASNGLVEVARLLLEKGAGINAYSSEFKESALTLACYKGHFHMVKFLLEAGADQDHQTEEMHTALMEACMDGHYDVAKLLINHGAKVC